MYWLRVYSLIHIVSLQKTNQILSGIVQTWYSSQIKIEVSNTLASLGSK